MIAIIDYGVGNLFSLSSSLSFLKLENIVTHDANDLDRASHIILPGVGAFGDAMEKLRATGLVPELLRQAQGGKPLLGICLGLKKVLNMANMRGWLCCPARSARLRRTWRRRVSLIRCRISGGTACSCIGMIARC